MTETIEKRAHFDVIDGWRGISILLVLAAHFLPLGPKAWRANDAAGVLGMALFFTLSGFLITGFLLRHSSVLDFLMRRIFRIVPLAWLCLTIALAYIGADGSVYPAHYLFYGNLPPFWLTGITAHFWSLCVEMQFYAFVALLFGAFGARGLRLLLPICIAVTGYRFANGATVSIVTWLRIDEILVGCILALALFGQLGPRPVAALRRLNPYFILAMLLVASHPGGSFMNYLRPYLAATLVGVTLVNGDRLMGHFLLLKPLKYIAEISYALYVIHPLVGATWLGTGMGWEKYAKRPLLFAAVLCLAHVSTFKFERPCIEFGKRLSAKLRSAKRELQQ